MKRHIADTRPRVPGSGLWVEEVWPVLGPRWWRDLQVKTKILLMMWDLTGSQWRWIRAEADPGPSLSTGLHRSRGGVDNGLYHGVSDEYKKHLRWMTRLHFLHQNKARYNPERETDKTKSQKGTDTVWTTHDVFSDNFQFCWLQSCS